MIATDDITLTTHQRGVVRFYPVAAILTWVVWVEFHGYSELNFRHTYPC